MTIIKQRAVISGTTHQKNLRNYINNDKKVLLRESQNMESCKDLKLWASYMSHTRDIYGHNRAARKGKDGKEAKNTILYHQILGFNPDECDVNGGVLSPDDCMRYAKQYAKDYYPYHEIVFALHNEFCKEDQTHRYAIHMVINRSNLSTGTRLNEGLGGKAKRERASRIRKMDSYWGLKQVEEGKINSITHHKQPSRVEKELEKKGITSYKTNLRELLRIAAKKAESLVEYRELLESWGVDTQFRNGRMYARDLDNRKFSFSVVKLDAQLNLNNLENHFSENQVHYPGKNKNTRYIDQVKNQYLDTIEKLYLTYRKDIQSIHGEALEDFPKFTLPRPSAEITNDTEVKRRILAYWRGADELRMSLSSNVRFEKKERMKNPQQKQDNMRTQRDNEQRSEKSQKR
ncbi:relaxase/mobilization nuclease domain-containing protein [Enterococcus sp. AN402]|uniref:relaxase/mobilization nuclease domain-containing protein n=1 Tax=Enterococcus sp. AN402 TaxID=3151386 RepID=UPI00345911BD